MDSEEVQMSGDENIKNEGMETECIMEKEDMSNEKLLTSTRPQVTKNSESQPLKEEPISPVCPAEEDNTKAQDECQPIVREAENSVLENSSISDGLQESLAQNESEMTGEQVVSGMDEGASDLHMNKLCKICRICGELTVLFDGPKRGVPKQDIVKHVKKVWNVDISNEDPDIYPVNVCQYCERKIKRLYQRVSKKKKCELYRKQPAEFSAHTTENCPVCMLKEDRPTTPCSPQSQVVEQDGAVACSSDIKEEGSRSNETMQSTEPRRNPARKRGWTDHSIPSSVSVGCQTEDGTENVTGLDEHDYSQDEALSQFLVIPKKFGGRTPYHKLSLTAVNTKYIRQDRLKPLIVHIEKFCQVHKENKIDVMFFLLMQSLRDAGDRVRETQVEDIWCRKNNMDFVLNDEECLAKRILLKQTKDQYRKEYSYYKEKLEKPVLKPPFIIDKLEKTYFPEFLEFFMTDGDAGPIVYQHEKRTHPSYFSITGSNEGGGKFDGSYAGIVGARWHYFDAIAKTLEELAHSLENKIHDLDEDTPLQVDLFDYCEEKRDLTNFGDKGDSTAVGRASQSKIITYFFGIQSMQSVVDNKVTCIYKSNPNSVQFRPLMKALVTEGSTLRHTIKSVEEERASMNEKIFYLTLPGGTPVRFMVYFTNATVEHRKDYRNISGLTLSSFKKVPAVINRYGNLCLELKRSWLATSPRLIHVGRITSCRTKCSRCGEQGHNVRKCSIKSEVHTGDPVVQHRKRKKKRSVPSLSYSNPLDRHASQIFIRESEVVDLCNQHQQQESQHSQQPIDHKPEDPLGHLTTAPTNIDQSASVIRNDEQILWACPNIGSGSPQISGTHAPGTQVLVPSSIPANVEFQTVPQRSQAQMSQGASGPVYVWTYTVVQPQHGGAQQQQLSLIPQQNSQQNVTQQAQQLSVIHPQSSLQGTSQEQISVVHQQSVQQGGSQQIAVIDQSAGQQAPSQQTHQLSVIHQHNAQMSSTHSTQVVPHQQQARRPSQDQPTQHVSLMQHEPVLPEITLIRPQPATQPQTSQQISAVHQSQASQQLNIVHQHQTSQSTNLVHQHPNQAQGTQHQSEPSQSQQQIVQSQDSELHPIIGQW